MKTKYCYTCEKRKLIRHFGRNSCTKDKLRANCKVCANKCAREYGAKYPERIKARMRRWRLANKERATATNRRWYMANKEHILVRDKRWRMANKKYIAERSRRWYMANKEYRAATQRRWYMANPIKVSAISHRRRAREYNAPGSFAVNDITRIRKSQNDKCHYCKMSLYNKGAVDHKTPLFRHGTNWPNNLCLACKFCNSSKGIKTELEFRQGI